jgi:DNA-binding NarL/FixJ family response regulator
VLHAAEHYRKVSRHVELASALEDAAVLLGEAGDAEAAAIALNESLEIYTELAASWDIRRAEERLAALGISRSVRPAEPHPDAGWESLSPLEVQIATLVAAGYSNPAIAGQLALPRRNVQTHVASVLRKLDGLSNDRVSKEERQHVPD